MKPINKDSGILTSDTTQTVVDTDAGTSQSTFISGAKRRYKQGFSIPGYHEKVSKGQLLPHTSFKQVDWEAFYNGGSYNHTDTGNGKVYNVSSWKGTNRFNSAWRTLDFFEYDCDPTEDPPQQVPDYFLQQAAARIYSSGFDALTASAEAKRTVQQFKGVTRRIVELARQFSHKRAAKLWLEGRYGWRTLAFDIRDLHSALTEFDEKREIWSERAGLSTAQQSTEVIGTASNNKLKFELERTVSHQWSLRGSVTGLIKPSKFILDPYKTAWELVPYSFVLDWVYNVGIALDAMSFLRSASAWSASKGFECKSTVTYTCRDTGSHSGYTGSANCSYTYTGVRQVRAPVNTIPKLPQVTNRPLTWDLLRDLEALARTRGRYRN